MRIVLGLGNPGPEYAETRHNAGFLLADALAARWQFPRFRREGKARLSRGSYRSVSVELIKPETYMNLSGAAIAPLIGRTGFDPAADLLVLVDDVALPVGRFRLRAEGSAGGHNGLKSVESVVHSRQYARLRIGVGPLPDEYGDLADFVLDPFTPEEWTAFEALTDRLAEAVECWVTDGIQQAMNRFNRKG